ncbi:hypothetical protein B0H19DRAFT_1225813 [Mycena capillaripes]|nr:hypothetical protein B0H19DRAFT_1225813 [Mycena capillaripes]
MLSFASFLVLTFGFIPSAAANFQPLDIHVFSVSEIAFPGLTLRSQATGFNFDLEKALPPASNTHGPPSPVGSNSTCAQYHGPGNECTADMESVDVLYEDCGSAFTICRCSDATMTMDTAVDRLGRIPVGLRRFVGDVMVFGGVTHAYTDLSTGGLHLFGESAMDTWVHEAAHAFDYADPSSPKSGSVNWLNALSEDSCATDDYALTNRVEAFAQTSVMKIYMLLHSGHMPSGFQSACMQNQLGFIATLPAFNPSRLFGNTCHIEDSSRGVRRKTGPLVLDATKTFQTVPLDPPAPLKTSAASVNSSASKWNWSRILVVLSTFSIAIGFP